MIIIMRFANLSENGKKLQYLKTKVELKLFAIFHIEENVKKSVNEQFVNEQANLRF